MFKKNVGNIDRIIRFILGAAIIGAGVYYENWLGAIGLVPLATAFMRSCPVYSMFGVSTCPMEGTPPQATDAPKQ